METILKGQLDRLTALTGRVCGYTDKIEKQKALEGILKKINDLIPDAINKNLLKIQAYEKFSIYNFSGCKYPSSGDDIDGLLRFVNGNIKAIQIFENDSKEQQGLRLSKHDEYKQHSFARYKVTKRIITNGIVTHKEEDEDPDWIYSERGTYTKYLSYKRKRYFPICLNIKMSKCTDFETVNYLLLLYIAVNNELNNVNEELYILGIIPQTPQQTIDVNANKANATVPVQQSDSVKPQQSDKKPITYYFKTNIYFKSESNKNDITVYLDELKKVFDFSTKATLGAVCLALFEKKLHNKDRVGVFTEFVCLLAEYWDVKPPKDIHKNKYKAEKEKLKGKYFILGEVSL
jgi:hypothetical protein